MTFKKLNLYCLLIIIFFSNNVVKVQSAISIKMNLLNQLNLLNRFNFTKLEREETRNKTQHIRIARDGNQPNVMQITPCATEDRCQTIKDIMCDPDTYDSLIYLQNTLTPRFWEQASQSDNRVVCITNRQKLVDGFSAMYRSIQDERCGFATESEEEMFANLMLLYNNIFCATNGDGDFCGSVLYSNIDIIPNDSDGCVDENENLFDEDCQDLNSVIVDTGCCVWSMFTVYIRTGDSHTSTCPEGMRQSFSEDYVTEYLDTCNIDHNNDIESRACGGSLDTTGGTTDTMLSTSDDTSSNSNIGLIVMGIIIGVVLIGTIINQIYIYFTNRNKQIDNNDDENDNNNNDDENDDNNNDSVSGEEDVFYGNNSPKPTSYISINFENPIQNRKLQNKRRRTLPKIPIENINKNNTVSV